MQIIAIAMTHRGRLNVLAHIMGKPYRQILADFHDPLSYQEKIQAIGWTVGDVNGGGKADLVGFGLDGVYIATAQ